MPWGSMGSIWAEMGLNYNGLSQGMRDATQQVRAFDREMESTFKAISQNISDSFSEAGRSLSIGITVPLTAAGGFAAKLSADFETAMANVWTIADISRQELQGLGREVEALSTRVPQSAKQLADGLYDAISSGIRDVGDAIGVVEIAAKAAQAGMSETATAVDALTSVLNSYGLAATEAGNITDIMFRTVDRGKITFGELAGSIGQVVSTAATANVAFEEIAAAYATLTRGGINAAEASTAINQAILSIIQPSKEAGDYAKQLGIEFNATALTSKGFAGVLEDIYQATGGNIEAISTLFPNVRALKGVLGLVRNEIQDYTSDLEQMATATGATEAAFAKQMETSAAKAQLFKNEIAALARSLGNELWPVLISITEALKPIIQAFTDLPAGTREAAVAWGLFAVALGPVMSGLSALIGLLTGPAGIVLGISAVVAGIYGWVNASRDLEDRIDRQVSSAQRAIREAMEQARAYGEQSNQLDKLIGEYEKLEGKPDKSEQEHERLRQVIDAIVQLAPQAVTGYDDMGRALIGNAEAAKRVRDELWQLRKEQLEIAAMRAEYELPMLEEQVKLLEPQFARTKRELDEIAPRYYRMREAVLALSKATTDAQRAQILQAATLEGVFDAFTPPTTQFAAAEQQYNKLYSVFTELSGALFRARSGLIELKNAQRELDEWMTRKPGEMAVSAAVSAGAATAPSIVKAITEEELSEFEKFGKKVAELSRDAFGLLQDEWTSIADKLKSTDPVEASWAEQRARALLGAIHGAIAQFEGDWTKAAEAAAKEVASGYESIKEKAIESQSELSKALSEFRHRIAIGKFVGFDAQLAELERIKSAYDGTAEEIQRVDEQLYQLREQRRSRAVRDALAQYQFEAQLYDYSYRDHANHLKRLLENEQLTLEEQKQIAQDMVLYEKRARDEIEQAEKDAADKASREAERQAKEAAAQQEQHVRDRIQAIQRQATLEEWSYTQIADAIQMVLDTEEMAARTRMDLAYEVALSRKRAVDKAAADEKMALDEAAREADRIAREAERQALEEERAQDARVKERIKGIERIAELEDWSLAKTADGIQEVLEAEQMTAGLRVDLAHRVAINRKRYAEEVAADEKKAAEDASREADRQAREAERQREQAVRNRIQSIQRQATLEEWSYEQIADAIRGVIDTEIMSAELRSDLAYQVALNRKRAADEAAADEEKAIARAIEAIKKRGREQERLEKEQARAQDERVRGLIEGIQRAATLHEWSYTRIAGEIQEVLDAELMSTQLRADLEYQVALNRKRAADEAVKDAEKQAENARKRAEEEAKAQDDLVKARLQGIQRIAQLEDWTAAEIAAGVQEILDTEQMSAELRIELAWQVAFNRKKAAEAGAEAERKAAAEGIAALDRELQFRRQIGAIDWETELQYLEDMALIDAETREARMNRAAQYYSAVSRLARGMKDEEIKALQAVLRESLATFSAMENGGEELAMALMALLDRLEERLSETAKTVTEMAQEMARGIQGIADSISTLAGMFGAGSEVQSGIRDLGRAIGDGVQLVASIGTGDVLGAITSGISMLANFGSAIDNLSPSVRAAKLEFRAMGDEIRRSLSGLDRFGRQASVQLTGLARSYQSQLEQWQRAAESRANAGFFTRAWWGLTGSAPSVGSKAGREAAQAFIESWKSIAGALESGVASSLQRGIKSFIDGTKRIADVLREGIRNAIIDAITQAMIQGALTQGALGALLGQLTDELAQRQWAAAQQTIQAIADEVPEVAAGMEQLLKPLADTLNAVLPSPEQARAGGRRGTQISEITGPTRDLLIETLRPLTVLDSLPIYAMAMETAIYEMRDAFLAYVGMKAATEAGAAAVINEYHISTINIYSSGKEDFDQLMTSLNRRAEIALLGSGA